LFLLFLRMLFNDDFVGFSCCSYDSENACSAVLCFSEAFIFSLLPRTTAIVYIAEWTRPGRVWCIKWRCCHDETACWVAFECVWISLWRYRAGGDCAFLFTPPNSLSLSPSLSFAGTLRDVLSGRGPSLGQHHDSPLLSMLYDNNSVTFNYIKRLYMLFY